MKINHSDEIKIITEDYDKHTYITPSAKIHYSHMHEIPLWELDSNEKDSRYYRILHNIRRVAGMRSDNNILKMKNIFGHSFAFSIHCHWTYDRGEKVKPKYWSISLWDETGGTSLLTINKDVVDFKTDTLSRLQVKRLTNASERYTKGIMACSQCNDEINLHTKENYGGQFYAGRYCTKCWEGGMKQKEAAENYN